MSLPPPLLRKFLTFFFRMNPSLSFSEGYPLRTCFLVLSNETSTQYNWIIQLEWFSKHIAFKWFSQLLIRVWHKVWNKIKWKMLPWCWFIWWHWEWIWSSEHKYTRGCVRNGTFFISTHRALDYCQLMLLSHYFDLIVNIECHHKKQNSFLSSLEKYT